MPVMSKERKSTPSDKMNKVPKTFRVPPETARRLERASKADGVSQSVYVDQALKAKFKKDGID
jgi:predicted DNA-binding protein